MGDSIVCQKWFDRALQDLDAANILHKNNGANELVAFHCQQAIEKQLKGWLLKCLGELLDGHNLTFLCRQAITAGARIQPYVRDIAFVNQFYVETRYPMDDYIEVSDKEVEDCLEIARTILDILN